VSDLVEYNIPNKWRPRPYQIPLLKYLSNGGTRAVAAWHRRAGKDEVALHWTAMASCQRPATYWHMLPEAAQARKAIWQAINPHTGMRRIDEVFPLEWREATNETEMLIKFKWGSTWQVVGSDNFNSLVGSPPAGVVGSEWALANPLAWAYLRPILAENNGWSVFISTPRGRNHFHKMLQTAQDNPLSFGQILTVENTNVFKPATLEEELHDFVKEYGEDNGTSLFRQEYYCSFDAAILGAIYGAWIEKAERSGRIGDVSYDSALPVHTAWDLGFDDATSIWFYQIARNEIRLIDFYESNGQPISHYCDILKDKKYEYGKHYVPHDAAHKLLAAGGRSIVQQAYELGIKMYVINATSQQNSIEATRKALNIMWFDKVKCDQGIESLRHYHFKYDADKRNYSSIPVHDFASHASDALEIIGRVWQQPKEPSKDDKPRFLHEMTAEEAFWGENESNNAADRY
jgi:phage terminase large subunit